MVACDLVVMKMFAFHFEPVQLVLKLSQILGVVEQPRVVAVVLPVHASSRWSIMRKRLILRVFLLGKKKKFFFNCINLNKSISFKSYKYISFF